MKPILTDFRSAGSGNRRGPGPCIRSGSGSALERLDVVERLQVLDRVGILLVGLQRQVRRLVGRERIDRLEHLGGCRVDWARASSAAGFGGRCLAGGLCSLRKL